MYSACFSGSWSIGCVIFQIGSPSGGRLSGRFSFDGPGLAASSISCRCRASTNAIRFSTERTESRYSSSLLPVGRPELAAQVVRLLQHQVDDALLVGIGLAAARARTAAPGGARRRQFGTTGLRPRNIRSNTSRGLASYGTGSSGAAERILVRGCQADLQRRQERLFAGRPRRRLVDGDRRVDQLALAFLTNVRAGQVQVGAVLVRVEVLAPPALRQPGEDQHVVLDELQRAQDRRQLRSGPASFGLHDSSTVPPVVVNNSHPQRRLYFLRRRKTLGACDQGGERFEEGQGHEGAGPMEHGAAGQRTVWNTHAGRILEGDGSTAAYDRRPR